LISSQYGTVKREFMKLISKFALFGHFCGSKRGQWQNIRDKSVIHFKYIAILGYLYARMNFYAKLVWQGQQKTSTGNFFGINFTDEGISPYISNRPKSYNAVNVQLSDTKPSL